MKKNIFTSILIVLLMITQISCSQSNRITNRDYDIATFSKIDVNTIGNIEIVQSEKLGVRAEGNANLVDELNVYVENGVLHLDLNEKLFKRFKPKKAKMVIYISAPNLEEINSNGVGNVSIKGNAKFPQLKIDCDGVGNIKSDNLICDNISILSNSVGNIKLIGSTNNLFVTVKNIGNINLRGLKSKNTTLNANGVGNIDCYASETIDITANGVGNIIYYGNPQVKNINKNSICKVRSGEN